MMDEVWIETLLKRFENERSVNRVVSVDKESASASGDNFTSSLDRWNVKVVLGSGRIKTKKFIVKILPTSPVARKYIVDYRLVPKEIDVYEKLFSSMDLIMDNYDDKREKLWCELVGYRPYDMIILQDLTVFNYSVPKRTEFMDMEHALLTMRALGRFHALSKVVVAEKLIDPNLCGPYQLIFDPRSVEVFFEGGVVGLYKAMERSWGPEWKMIAESLKKVAKETEKRVKELSVSEERHNVFNHGDLWLCNLMFKYDDYKNVPISIKFIDFQLSTYNSFAWDLTFLLYTSVTPEFRRRNTKILYDAYYETLKFTLDFYKYGGNYPSRECIDTEMDRLKFIGFISQCTMYALSLAEVDAPFNLDVFDSDLDPKAGFKIEIYESDIYKKTTEEDLRIFYRENVI